MEGFKDTAMASQNPEISSVSVVLIGSFNPQIFQPTWFSCEELIRKEEAEAAKIQIIHPEVVVFDLEWLRMEVTRDRFVAITEKESSFDILRDLVLGTFRILRHTPIRMMGLNRDMHFRMASEEEWHAVGHRLAPKEPWNGIIEKPGMRTLIMQGKRPDDFKGFIVVRVEPSLRVPQGVHIQVNDHYQIEDQKAMDGCDIIMGILDSSWKTSQERSKKIIYDLMEAK